VITQHKPALKEKKLRNQEDKLNEINRKKIKNKSKLIKIKEEELYKNEHQW
jgi:hypothetical protein